MIKIITLLFVAILCFSFSAMAADMPTQEQQPAVTVAPATVAQPAQVAAPVPAKTGSYPPGPIQKLERGFTNTAFGWTEIPKRVVDKTKESNPIRGSILGLFQGTCRAFARTASGVSEVLTFPIGRYDRPRVLDDMPAAQ